MYLVIFSQFAQLIYTAINPAKVEVSLYAEPEILAEEAAMEVIWGFGTKATVVMSLYHS